MRSLLAGLLAGVLLVLVLPAGASAVGKPAVRRWGQSIRRTGLPGTGCFRASYPTVAWQRVRCAPATPSYLHETPRQRSATQGSFGSLSQLGGEGEVGGKHGGVYSAEVQSGLITSAVGSIPSVSAKATEEDEKTPEKFSLQLNSQFFSGTPACQGVAGCQGWEQFIYSSSLNQVFIEFWLINFLPGGKECPNGWATFENDCHLKSEKTPLTGGALKVSGLTGATLEGRANSAGKDAVVLVTATGNATASAAPSTLDLDNSWKVAEFAVLGDFEGSEANFSPDTTITVNTGVRSSAQSDAIPICTKTEFTAESNNLTAEGTPALSPQAIPTVSSQQTNGSSAELSCATWGIGPPSVTLTTPPEGGVYSYGQAVDAEYSCAAAAEATLASCTGTVPKGSPIDTTTATSNTFTVTAEDTDGQKETVTHSYTVTPEAPKATISAPGSGGFYKLGQIVPTEFSCEEGALGSGLESCDDSHGTNTASGGGGTLDTSTVGEHTYTVTAKSKDGETRSTSITYTVPAPPTATISAPTETIFEVGQAVTTTFSCHEGEFGPGLASCDDNRGTNTLSGGTGTLDTSTAGPHTYTVTATSKDGQSATAVLEYTVAFRLSAGTTNCNSYYFGNGASVTVPANGHCTLLAPTKVTGSVQAQKPGGVLVDEGAQIGGTLQLDGASAFQLYGGGSIGGNLIVEGLTGRPAKGNDELCDTTIHGNVQVLDNRAGAPLDIGDMGSCKLTSPLTIGGYLQVQRNAAPITVAGNTIGRYLLVYADKAELTIVGNNVGSTIHVYSNSKDASSTLTGNLSREACTLQGDSPPIVGSANATTTGSNLCNREA